MDVRSSHQEPGPTPPPGPPEPTAPFTEGPQPKAPSPEALAGWCEAASRLLTPLLSSPHVKARLRIVLGHLDPDYAPVLVRTLVRTDPELPLAFLSALPRLGNALIEGAAELTRALGAFPPALLGSVTRSLLADLRPRPLGEALGRALRLARDVPSSADAPASFWSAVAEGFGAGYGAPPADADRAAEPSALAAHAQGLSRALAALLAAHPELVTSLAEALKDAFEAHPSLLRQGLVPLVAPLHDALHEATQGSTQEQGQGGEAMP